jgi:DNA-binding NtrC family response regulator
MTSRTVLVVEDERNVREPLTHLLQLRHFDVVSADTAAGAVALLEQGTPSAAIVDLRLKRGTGRDVVARVPAAVPVIIFSGVAETGGLEHLRPATRFVEKPCSLTWLIDQLDAMLAA